MKTKRTIGLAAVSLALVLSILACGGGKVSAPTAVPAKPTAITEKPTATEEVAQPTPTKKPAKPTATEASAQPTEATANATADCSNVPDGELGVAYDRGYLDNTDGWRVIGLICNNTKEAVSDIELSVEVFDTAGKSIDKEENKYAALTYVDAGEATPFGVEISKDLPDADTYQVTITNSSSATLHRAAVESQGVVMVVDDNGKVQLTGELVNNGKDPVAINGLAAATFDQNGKVVSADYSDVLIHYLDPGKAGPFRISMNAPKDGADVKDYTLYTDVETTDVQDFLISAKDDLTDISEFFDANGDYHMAGEMTSSADKDVTVRLLVTLYDKDGNVIDASYADDPFTSLAPKETVPYEFSLWGPVASKKGTYDAFDKWKIQVDPSLTFATDTQMVDLTKSVSDETNSFDKNQGTFNGTVKNTSGSDLKSVMIVVGIYGKKGEKDAGKLLSTGYGYADFQDTLANGKSAQYTVYVPIPTDFDKTKYEYDVIVKGQKP